MNTSASQNQSKKLEPMADFFTARLDGYEAHMLRDGDKGYEKFAGLVPSSAKALLDLGCGTGLELDWIFKRLPDVSVTGIDLTQAMLDKLKAKHPDKNLTLICGNYFEEDFGVNAYDAVVSFDTLHHFTHEQKAALYRKIREVLKPGGLYLEGDYMVDSQEEEDKFYAENARVRREQNIPDSAFYHFDTPCTVENQIKLLEQAGFRRVAFVGRFGIDALILAVK
jgi:cyclopropane fatty-acyl-phospholipid synthase-like methyltransferase